MGAVMKKLSALILSAAVMLTITGCDSEGTSSDLQSVAQSGTNSDSTDNSNTSENPLAAMPEWEYASLVRDNYKLYFIASSSPSGDLPNVSSNLLVRSLETAVADDLTGRLSVLLGEFMTEESLEKRIDITDEVLNILCETDKITEENAFISMKKLAVLEGFWGTGDKFPAPTSELTAQPLDEAYTYLTERYCMAMLGSQLLVYTDLIGSEKGDDGKYTAKMDDYNKRVTEDYKSGALSEKQLKDNVIYLAYYGAMRDKSLAMLNNFREYAKVNIPEAEKAVNEAVAEAAELFSGINGVVIE